MFRVFTFCFVFWNVFAACFAIAQSMTSPLIAADSEEILIVNICSAPPAPDRSDAVMSMIKILQRMDHTVSLLGKRFCFHGNRSVHDDYIRKHISVVVERTPGLYNIQELLLDKKPFLNTVIFVGESEMTSSSAVDFLGPLLKNTIEDVRIILWLPQVFAPSVREARKLVNSFSNTLDPDQTLNRSLHRVPVDERRELALLSSDIIHDIAVTNLFTKNLMHKTRVSSPKAPTIRHIRQSMDDAVITSGRERIPSFANVTRAPPCALLMLADRESVWNRLSHRMFFASVWPQIKHSVSSNCSVTVGFTTTAPTIEAWLGPALAAGFRHSKFRFVENILSVKQKYEMLRASLVLDFDIASAALHFRNLYAMALGLPLLTTSHQWHLLQPRADIKPMTNISLATDVGSASPVWVCDDASQWGLSVRLLHEASSEYRQAQSSSAKSFVQLHYSMDAGTDDWLRMFGG
jgi:hypothetical protein